MFGRKARQPVQQKQSKAKNKVLVYKAKDGFRWRLIAANYRIVAESGEAYAKRQNVMYAVNSLPRFIGDAEVVDQTKEQES